MYTMTNELTLDETYEILMSEESPDINLAIKKISESNKLYNGIINSLGLHIIQLPLDATKNIMYLLALTYLMGRHQAIAELQEELKEI